MNIVLDIAVLVIIVFFIYRGWKKGLIHQLFGFLSAFLALAFAYVTASPVAALFANILREPVTNRATEALRSITGNLSVETLTRDKPARFVELLSSFGTTPAEADAQFGELVSQGAEGADGRFVDWLITPVLEKLSYVLAFLLLFIVGLIACRILRGLLKGVFKLPVLSWIDKAGGLALGILLALIWFYVLSLLAHYLLPYLHSYNPDLFSGDEVERSYLFRHIYEFVYGR